MKYIIYNSKFLIAGLALFLVFGTVSLAAQNKSDLNREMEVTRDFEPTVEKATKLDIKPNLVDTISLKPEVDYRVTPTPITYGFEPAPIKAAGINTETYRPSSPIYVKAGAGYPFRTLFDFYYSSKGDLDGKFGAYINHTGRWSKIKNDDNIKADATDTRNKAGVFGEYKFGRMSVDGEIGYDYDMVARYGYHMSTYNYEQGGNTLLFEHALPYLLQDFSTVRGKVNFGNAFEDLSYFNFKLGADAAYFNDKFNYAQSDFKGYLAVGKLFNNTHEVTLRAQYEAYSGSKNLDYSNNIASVTPMYRMRTDKVNIALGFTYSYDDLKGSAGDIKNNKGYFFPQLDLRFDLANGYLVPYVKVDGMLRNNGYRSMVAQNPYVIQGLFAYNTAEYNGRAGIAGSISSSFSYKVYAGVTLYKNLIMFGNVYYAGSAHNLFSFIYDDATMYTVGGDLEGRVSGSFGVEASLQFMGYEMDVLDKAVGLPNFTGRLGVKYNYQDKLTIKAGANLTGRRFFHETNPLLPTASGEFNVVEKNAVVNVDLGAEYSVSSKLGVFVEVDNLLNQKLYPFNHYPSFGISALGGVKITF